MKSFVRFTAIPIIVLVAVGFSFAENKYTGAKMCAACHKGGKGGTAFAVWEKSAHAKAFQTLFSDASKKIAKDKGLKTAPSESPACLKCHITGGGAAKNVEASFKREEGITCEACHGAASGYKMLHNKGDLAKSKAAGMDPGQKDAKFCITCHNAESPSHKSAFKLDEMWSKMEHGLPAKK